MEFLINQSKCIFEYSRLIIEARELIERDMFDSYNELMVTFLTDDTHVT